MNKCFQSNLDHLLAELKRVELKLHHQIMKLRQAGNYTEEDKFRSLYISEKEIDTIVDSLSLPSIDRLSRPDDTVLKTLTDSLKQLEADISEKKRE
ncbi:hypothetical protein KA005_40425, partial [bacterium]|nr:hypothetical protein [bacterium]